MKTPTKQELRAKAKALGLTLAQFLRQPAIVRWYPPKAKAADEQDASK